MPQDLTAQRAELRQLIGQLQRVRAEMELRPQVLRDEERRRGWPDPGATELRFNLLDDKARRRLHRSRERSGDECRRQWASIEAAHRELQLARERLRQERERAARARQGARSSRWWFRD